MQTISYKGVRTERGAILWYVTIDDRVLGDSRPFDTADDASDAARKICEESIVDGYRTRVYRPGY